MTDRSAAPLVLVVEDHADAREMYAAGLELAGFRVAEAADGLQAIASAIELRPAVIIMDLSLPRLDGWAATRQLKTDARTTSIPVVALSGHTLPRYIDEARAAGCVAVLVKPCLPDAVVAEGRRALG